MTTVRQIAERAGVSISTVSLVMNNKPGVSEPTRRLIMDAIRELEAQNGHQRTSQRRKLNDSTTSGLSIVVLHPPVLSSYYVFSQVLQGIEAAAAANRAQLRLVANEPQAVEQHVAHLYLSDPNLRPDGLLMFGARRSEPLIDAAQQVGIPCVVLGREPHKYAVSSLGRDEEGCGYMAAHYLLELGHRALAFVGGDEGFDYVHNRLKGCRRAVQARDSVVLQVQLGDGTAAIETVLAEAPDVTAILFVNDQFAAAGLPVIQAHGLTIPDDLSVLSFDNTDIAGAADPPLTSISYHFYEEGQWAIKMLLDHICNPALERVHTYFKGELIERESCAPPKSDNL